ncbi:MAG: DUF445 family protein [Deltaproteobacteria bacterium]|nr:DUF445 family protein [Deltaproteobacteria bacterium]
MHPFIIYLAPPLVGAFIGYMTNYVAIRMLFRPLRPWRLFGCRLPMTPGVIPSKRHDLAKNIGRMVGRHLLTGQDISKALHGAAFKTQLANVINLKVENLLLRDLGPIGTIIPRHFRSYFEAGLKILRWRSLKILHNYLASETFAASLAQIIADHLEVFLQKPVHEVVPEAGRAQLLSFVETLLSNTLTNRDTEQWLQRYIDAKIDTAIAERSSINDLLPKPFTLLIINLLENEVPSLLKKTAQIANEPESQDKIIAAICTAISNFIGSLGPMAALAAGFLSPELIHSKVKEYLQDHGDELAVWLLSEDVQGKTRELLRNTADGFLNQPLTVMLADVEEQKIVAVRGEISRQIARGLQDPQITKAITNLLSEALNAQAQKSVQEIIRVLFGEAGIHGARKWTSEELINLIRSTQVRQILDRMVGDLLWENIFSRPIGSLNKLLPKAVQSGLGEYIFQQTSTLLSHEVPGLLDSLNIEQVVVKKVDSLDLLHLEDLLLSIMQEQFKYINLFGGLLGFIIGLLNLLFI